jgi:hypothetical protein
MPRRCIGDVVLKRHSLQTSAVRGIELSIKVIRKLVFCLLPCLVSWHRALPRIQDGTVCTSLFSMKRPVHKDGYVYALGFLVQCYGKNYVPICCCMRNFQWRRLQERSVYTRACSCWNHIRGTVPVRAATVYVYYAVGEKVCGGLTQRRLGELTEGNISARVENGYPAFHSLATVLIELLEHKAQNSHKIFVHSRWKLPIYALLHSPQKCCDMTPESRNSPLLDIGSLTRSMEMRIRGDRLGTERTFHVNGLNKQIPWIRASNKQIPWLRVSNKHFPWIQPRL